MYLYIHKYSVLAALYLPKIHSEISLVLCVCVTERNKLVMRHADLCHVIFMLAPVSS